MTQLDRVGTGAQLTGRRILYASTNHGWSRGWTFYQQLATALGEENDVAYVDVPLSAARLFRTPETGPHTSRVRVVESVTLPLQRHDAVRRLGARASARQIARWARRTGFSPDLVWTYAPAELEYASRFPDASLVYWTGDEVLLPGEDALLERADAVLCVSDPVYERHAARYGDKVHFVPVACDYEAWQAAADDVDPRLKGLPRPVLGYSGWINDRVDVSLLRELAARTPGTLVLAGPIERVDVRDLERATNVEVLGPQVAEAVPRIVNGFDVALIPYLDSAFNRGSNPVKFYEYLALGKAVVTTDVPTLRRFAGVASIGDTSSFVERALGPVPGDEVSRREVARLHSFPVLLERLGSLGL